ncbi:MAG: sensor histidine kinase [Opitutaceae bacterium]
MSALCVVAVLAIGFWAFFLDEVPSTLDGSRSLRVYQIPQEIDALEEEADVLHAEIEKLPSIEKTLQFDQYGYHGGYLPQLDELPGEPRWTVDVRFLKGAKMKQVILVPAMDRRFDERSSYGFPLRFRISKIFQDGSTEVIDEWLDQDCPNPGRMPMIIDVAEEWPRGFRIEVFKGAVEGERELFALDEAYGITSKGEITNAESVNVSSSFESLPYWHEDYLTDQKTSLGLPLGGVEGDSVSALSTEFNAVFDQASTERLSIEFDLGENKELGWLSLYPASIQNGILIPGFGFPGGIEVLVYREDKAGKPVPQRLNRLLKYENLRPAHNLLRLPLYSLNARWIRVHFSDFPSSGDQSYFSMGEAMISFKNVPYPIQSMRILNAPEFEINGLEALFDGQAAGRPVMFRLDWMQLVEQRRALLGELETVVTQSRLLREHLDRIYWVAGVSAVAVVLLSAITLSMYLIVQRRLESRKLREQITTDLHDDIGSSLSAISLSLRGMRRHADNDKLHESCTKVDSIIARVQSSFHDVLWFTNTDTDTLEQMLSKLVHVAEENVGRDQLVMDCPSTQTVPDRKLKVMFKRDLLLIYREAINNAIKHSKASEIRITFRWTKNSLTISIADNGVGFVVDEVASQQGSRPHLGLESLKRRAKRLHATFELISSPQDGTHLSLTIPL